MSPEQSEEYAAQYALGGLEGAEKRAFEQELAKNAVTAAMVAEFEKASSLLIATVPKLAAPAALKSRILEGVQPRQPAADPGKKTEFSPAWAAWGVAAAAGIACVVLMASKSQMTNANTRLTEENKSLQVRIAGLHAERERIEARLNTLESERKSLDARVASLQPPKDPLKSVQSFRLGPQGLAKPDTEVIATWDGERQEGVLNLSRLPIPPPDRSYQLWMLTPDSTQPVDAGLIVSETARLEFKAPFPVKLARLVITLEPQGGSPAPTTVVYAGSL